jgi:putative membrane protein
MKRVIRHFSVDTVSLYLASSIASGLLFSKGLETLLLAGLGLTIASLIAKPIINVLMLPINLITFGLFRWVASVVTLYLVTLLVPGFKIAGFVFAGYSSVWFDLPGVSLAGFVAIIAFSFVQSLFASFIYWLMK